jgi:hypothetical protein
MYIDMTRNASSWKKLRWLLVPIVGWVAFLLWQHWPKPANIPAELIGVWKTSDPKYAGRSFEIDLVSVNFGTGDGRSSTGFVEKIDGVSDGGGTVYTISYDTDGVENQCSFYYSEQKGKTIVFSNQPGIAWSKVKDF